MSENCGAFTYELYDGATGQPLPSPTIFTVVTNQGVNPFIRGTIPSRVPYLANSPLQLRIRTTVEFSSKETISVPLFITVQDPCFQTQL